MFLTLMLIISSKSAEKRKKKTYLILLKFKFNCSHLILNYSWVYQSILKAIAVNLLQNAEGELLLILK